MSVNLSFNISVCQCQYVCPSIYLYIYILSLYIYIYMSIYLSSFYSTSPVLNLLSNWPSFYLAFHLSVSFFYTSVNLSICPYIYIISYTHMYKYRSTLVSFYQSIWYLSFLLSKILNRSVQYGVIIYITKIFISISSTSFSG